MKTVKFDIEKVSDDLLKKVEKFGDEKTAKGSMHDRDIKDLYGYLKWYKGDIGLNLKEPMDIVIIYKKFDDKVKDLYDKLNLKIANSNKIGIYFRGKPGVHAFMFPGMFSLWFFTIEECLEKMKKKQIGF